MAGIGVTAALTAGALVAFLSVATFVAFKGFPFGASSEDPGAAYLESSASAAPTAAAGALAAARGAVAENPVAGPEGSSAGPGATAKRSDGSGGSGASIGSGLDRGGASGDAPSIGGPGDPGISSPPPDAGSSPIPTPSLPSTSGLTTDVVRAVDDTVGTNLSGPSRGVTRAVDGVVSGSSIERAGRGVVRTSELRPAVP